ncbi:uncharacterized protein LOC111100662 isoform X2 [Crassostrea virginica]
MALPMLQVGAVLTSLVCTKVPLPTRPHCYRDTAGPFPQKFKCCPFDYVFINYERICSCVPKSYAQRIRDNKPPRQHSYNNKSGYNTQGNRHFKSYGYTQSTRSQYGYHEKKKYNNGYNLSQNSRRGIRYPAPSESMSKRAKVASVERGYRLNRQNRQRQVALNRRRTGSKSLSRKPNVPVKTVYESFSTREPLEQQRGKSVSKSRTASVTPERKPVYVLGPNSGSLQSGVPATAEVQDRQTVKQILKSKGTSILKRTQHREPRVKLKTTRTKSLQNSYIQNNAKSTKNNLSSKFSETPMTKTLLNIQHSENGNTLNHSAQNLISNSRISQKTRRIPIYFLNYNLVNGDVVHMPVIYEYHPVLPAGIDRAIPLPGKRGFLVPVSIFVMTSGRFVYNPAILRRHSSLLSRIRLARQRGISIEPVPLKRDSIQSHELSTYLNAHSHPFDDIMLENPIINNPLHDVVPLEVHDQTPKSKFLGSDPSKTGSNVQSLSNGKGSSSNNIPENIQRLSLSKVTTHSNRGSLNNFKDVQAAIVDTIRNVPLIHGNNDNIKLQNLRVISNRDFLDTSSRVKQTFNPNWIPDLQLFKMLTGVTTIPPSNSLPKGGNFQTSMDNRVDLHNIISNIPLDSRFDLKTNNLGRPIPDIPGPLSLRRQNHNQNQYLHLTGIHKGPVAFPSNRASPPGVAGTLSGSIRPMPASIAKNSESSVPIPSTGFVDLNMMDASFPSTPGAQPGSLNSMLPNIVIPTNLPIDPQNKVVLKFPGVSVKRPTQSPASLGNHLPNSKTGIPPASLGNHLPNSKTGKPPASLGNHPPDSRTGIPPVSLGNHPSNSKTGIPPASLGNHPLNSKTGKPPASLGNHPPDSRTGIPPVSLGNHPSNSRTGIPPASLGNHPLNSKTGKPPASLGNHPPDSRTGIPPASLGNHPPDSRTGIPPASLGNHSPDSKTGIPPASLGNHPLNSKTGIPPASLGNHPSNSRTGIPPASLGNHPSNSRTGIPPASLGNHPSNSKTGIPPASLGNHPPNSKTGIPPASLGNHPPNSKTGIPPASLGNHPYNSKTRIPPTSLGYHPPDSKTGIPPASLGNHPPDPGTGMARSNASPTRDKSAVNVAIGTSIIQQPFSGQNSILPNPLLDTRHVKVSNNIYTGLTISGVTEKAGNAQTLSNDIPNPLAGKSNSLGKLSKPTETLRAGKAKIQVDLSGHTNRLPNPLTGTGNALSEFNKIPSTKVGNPLSNVDNVPYRGSGGVVTLEPPNKLFGQGRMQTPGLLGSVPGPSSRSTNIVVTGIQELLLRTSSVIQGKLSGNVRGKTQDKVRGMMDATATRLLENSIRNRENSLFSSDRFRIPIQRTRFRGPFNPRMLTKQGAFTYKTFFNPRPTGSNTGSTSDRNGVIGIIKGNRKVYPIPIFPGAINGNVGEPVYHSLDQGLDIFNGQEFSPFLDPTTNLPVGFTVKKFNNDVGSVVDLVQNGVKLKKSDTGRRPGSGAKQARPAGNGVYKLLQNDGAIREIVSVLQRNRETARPNGNELVIPPEIIGAKARNDIVMYLEDMKSSKSLAKKPGNDTVPADLAKLLRNPVFVRYINNKTQESTPNTVDVSRQQNASLILNRISVSQDPLPMETVKNVSFETPMLFTKSNTKVLNSKSNDAMVFLTAKPIPPSIQKSRASVLVKEDPLIALPPVPVLKFDNVEGGQPKPLNINLTKELCRGCTIDGGLGYANHPSRCDRFIVCYPGEGGNLVPIEQQCPFGLFWSQNALTCRLPKDVKCPYDVCLTMRERHQYPHQENCQSYWECRGGFSVPVCCPPDQAFREGQGCVANDGSCRSLCPVGNSEIQPLYWQGKCDKRAVPGYRNKFERHVYYEENAGVAGRIQEEWMIQECSPGTEFHPEVCDCRVSRDLAALSKAEQVCSPDVYLPFTHDLKDESVSRTHVRADNVTLTTSGTACFIGRSVLAMPKFANMDLGSYLHVRLRYRHSSASPKNEVLLYNGDCERKPSLILGSTVEGNFVSVVSTTGEQHTLHVKSTIPATEWRTVSLVINNGHVQVMSDTMTQQKNAFGVLERAQCGMKLGWGEGYEQFNGCIDDFILYRCKHEGVTKG